MKEFFLHLLPPPSPAFAGNIFSPESMPTPHLSSIQKGILQEQGERALEAFCEKAAVITELMGALTASQELLPDRVEKLKASNQDYKYRLAMAKQRLMEIKMAEIPADQQHAFLFEQDIESMVMRNAVNELTNVHSGICGVFVGNDEAGYSFIIGSANADCMKVGAILREKTGAKCGGKKPMIQGSVQACEGELRAVLSDIQI